MIAVKIIFVKSGRGKAQLWGQLPQTPMAMCMPSKNKLHELLCKYFYKLDVLPVIKPTALKH